ncbi:unnamed protein product, partial [Prorocentrum cordatum]
ASVDLQAYVHASHGEGYCARNPSNDPCLGWQVFGDGCTDCAANAASTPAPSLRGSSTDPQRHEQQRPGVCFPAVHRRAAKLRLLGWLGHQGQRVPAAVARPVCRDCLVQVVLGGRGLRMDLRPDGRHQGQRRPAGVRPRVSRRG